MPTVSHASLTGNDLHEPKGISTAAANTVYIANGSGSGTWSKQDEIAIFYSTNNNTYPADTWNVIPFTTTIVNNLSITLSNNTFSVPAGKYLITSKVSLYNSSGTSRATAIRVRNISDNTTITPVFNFTCSTPVSIIPTTHLLELTVTKDIQLHAYISAANYTLYSSTLGGETACSTFISFHRLRY